MSACRQTPPARTRRHGPLEATVVKGGLILAAVTMAAALAACTWEAGDSGTQTATPRPPRVLSMPDPMQARALLHLQAHLLAHLRLSWADPGVRVVWVGGLGDLSMTAFDEEVTGTLQYYDYWLSDAPEPYTRESLDLCNAPFTWFPPSNEFDMGAVDCTDTELDDRSRAYMSAFLDWQAWIHDKDWVVSVYVYDLDWQEGKFNFDVPAGSEERYTPTKYRGLVGILYADRTVAACRASWAGYDEPALEECSSLGTDEP